MAESLWQKKHVASVIHSADVVGQRTRAPQTQAAACPAPKKQCGRDGAVGGAYDACGTDVCGGRVRGGRLDLRGPCISMLLFV